jgi:hypothetical protein
VVGNTIKKKKGRKVSACTILVHKHHMTSYSFKDSTSLKVGESDVALELLPVFFSIRRHREKYRHKGVHRKVGNLAPVSIQLERDSEVGHIDEIFSLEKEGRV